jgi:hypothetical protein
MPRAAGSRRARASRPRGKYRPARAHEARRLAHDLLRAGTSTSTSRAKTRSEPTGGEPRRAAVAVKQPDVPHPAPRDVPPTSAGQRPANAPGVTCGSILTGTQCAVSHLLTDGARHLQGRCRGFDSLRAHPGDVQLCAAMRRGPADPNQRTCHLSRQEHRAPRRLRVLRVNSFRAAALAAQGLGTVAVAVAVAPSWLATTRVKVSPERAQRTALPDGGTTVVPPGPDRVALAPSLAQVTVT